jgi:hypothetical protein
MFPYTPPFERKNSSILDWTGEKIRIFIFGVQRLSVQCGGSKLMALDNGSSSAGLQLLEDGAKGVLRLQNAKKEICGCHASKRSRASN